MSDVWTMMQLALSQSATLVFILWLN